MRRESTLNMKICGLEVTMTTSNIHIKDSYKVVCPWDMRTVLDNIREYVQMSGIKMDCPLYHRSNWSMKREWITHNNLYDLGYKRERTGSVDLNYPQKWWVKVLYFLGSIFII